MNVTNTALGLAVFLAAIAANADGSEINVSSVGVTLIEQAEVPAREAGVIVDVMVREGQHVKAGKVLAQIDDVQSRLELNRAKIEHENAVKQADNDVKIRLAEKSLEHAEVELKRTEDSRKRYPKSVTESQLLARKIAVDRGRLELEQAQISRHRRNFARHRRG